MHLGIALIVLILRRARGADDRGVHDGAVGDLDAVLSQVLVYRLSKTLPNLFFSSRGHAKFVLGPEYVYRRIRTLQTT